MAVQVRAVVRALTKATEDGAVSIRKSLSILRDNDVSKLILNNTPT